MGNRNFTAFCKATNSTSLTQDNQLQIVFSTPEIMAFAVNKEKKSVVLHSIKNLGRTLTCLQNKVLALLGSLSITRNLPQRQSRRVDCRVSPQGPQNQTPNFEDTKDRVTKDEIKGVAVLAQVSAACANLSGIVVLSPFLTETILRLTSIVGEEELDPIKLVERALAAARDLDTKRKEDNDYSERGLEKSKQLVRWLLSVYHGFIKKTEFKPEENNQDLQTYHVQQHIQWIIPPLGDSCRVEIIEGELSHLHHQSIQVNPTLS